MQNCNWIFFGKSDSFFSITCSFNSIVDKIKDIAYSKLRIWKRHFCSLHKRPYCRTLMDKNKHNVVSEKNLRLFSYGITLQCYEENFTNFHFFPYFSKMGHGFFWLASLSLYFHFMMMMNISFFFHENELRVTFTTISRSTKCGNSRNFLSFFSVNFGNFI